MNTSLPLPERVERLTEWLLKRLTQLAKEEQKKPWVEEESQLLDEEDYVRVYQKLQRNNHYTDETFDDFDRERDLLTGIVVNRHFKPLRNWVKKKRFIDIPGVYRQLFTRPEWLPRQMVPERWAAICEQTVGMLDASQLAWEDAVPYLYLKEWLEGSAKDTVVRHLFIDEAQDYSPFQLAYLKRRFPRSRMTILGDWNQAISAYARGEVGWAVQALMEGEPEAQTETIALRRSYRSTRPIIQFTRQMIPGGEAVIPFNRDGVLPTLVWVSDERALLTNITRRITQWQAEGQRTIALICKTARESERLHRLLKNKVDLRLITKETASFEPGVLVLPVYLAKGIEFDAVILPDVSAAQYGDEADRKLLYTACTRAMHALQLCCQGELSPFIVEIDTKDYIVEGNA